MDMDLLSFIEANDYPRFCARLRGTLNYLEVERAIGYASHFNRGRMLNKLLHDRRFDASADKWWVLKDAWEDRKYKSYARLLFYRLFAL